MMKTLKDLRAALVVGSRWHLQQSGWHVEDKGWSPGVRELGHVQGNAFAFKSNDPVPNPPGGRSRHKTSPVLVTRLALVAHRH